LLFLLSSVIVSRRLKL